jgi:tRNA nucleotidyltransferase/poly(A) polymerase
MKQPTTQREFALDVVRQLRAAGYESLWAGGCVRDQLLGITPKDYDVATSAKPDEIHDLFGNRRTLAIGAAFGVITVLGPRSAGQIEVATFRTDAAYSDGRHPDSVTFTTAEEDARRRDFTINGLFYDPLAEQVVDYVNGQRDLTDQVIRAIGDPHQRFDEDKLRLLRAVRFAAAFGFRIEEETFRAIQRRAADITSVSAERIGAEIRRMLTDAQRTTAVELLRDSGLLPHVLPEVAALDSSAWQKTLRVLGELDGPTLPLALAALLLCVENTPVAGTVGRRLRYTSKEMDRAGWLLSNLATIRAADEIAWPRLQRVLVHDGAEELLALHAAIAGPDDAALAFCRERLAWPTERLNPAPLVDGADLIAHGLEPGPQFAALLERIRDSQLDGHIASRTDALRLVDRLLAEGLDAPP